MQISVVDLAQEKGGATHLLVHRGGWGARPFSHHFYQRTRPCSLCLFLRGLVTVVAALFCWHMYIFLFLSMQQTVRCLRADLPVG